MSELELGLYWPGLIGGGVPCKLSRQWLESHVSMTPLEIAWGVRFGLLDFDARDEIGESLEALKEDSSVWPEYELSSARGDRIPELRSDVWRVWAYATVLWASGNAADKDMRDSIGALFGFFGYPDSMSGMVGMGAGGKTLNAHGPRGPDRGRRAVRHYLKLEAKHYDPAVWRE
jgi:hypothetical protein